MLLLFKQQQPKKDSRIEDRHSFIFLQEYIANTNYQSVVVNTLDEPIIARYIRIHPVAWYGHISMRIELYGCYSGEIDEVLTWTSIYIAFSCYTLPTNLPTI